VTWSRLQRTDKHAKVTSPLQSPPGTCGTVSTMSSWPSCLAAGSTAQPSSSSLPMLLISLMQCLDWSNRPPSAPNYCHPLSWCTFPRLTPISSLATLLTVFLREVIFSKTLTEVSTPSTPNFPDQLDGREVSSTGTADNLGQTIPGGTDCPVRSGTVSSTPDLYSRDAVSTPDLAMTTKNVFRYWQMSPSKRIGPTERKCFSLFNIPQQKPVSLTKCNLLWIYWGSHTKLLSSVHVLFMRHKGFL
jgi:hypothetical protein